MAAYTGTSMKSYKSNDPKGKQTTHDILHCREIETSRIQFQDEFLEAAAALASTTKSKSYWTGAGTNGTQAIAAGGTMTLDTTTTGSSTSTLTFSNSSFPISENPSLITKVALSAITTTKFEVGFYATSNDYLVFRFDTALSATNLYVASKNNGGTEVKMDTGVAVTANTYIKLAIDIFADGTFNLYINNVKVNGFTGTIKSDLTTLVPYFYVDNKTAAASRVLSIDIVKVAMDTNV